MFAVALGVVLATAAPASAAGDLRVTLADSPDPVMAGANLTYTIAVSNAGTTDATSVSMQDVIPAGTTFVSLTAPPGWTATTPAVGGTGTISATNASVAPGSSHVFTLVVNVNGSTSGTLTDTATVTSNPADPTPADNSATVSTTVARVSDLRFSGGANPSPAVPGSTITFSLALSNQGPNDAQGTVVSFPIPPETTFVSATQSSGPAFTITTPAVGGTSPVTFTLGSFASGATATFTVRVALAANPTRERVIAQPSATSTSSDPNPGGPPLSVEVDRADLGVTVDAATAAVAPGGDATFPITLTNDGTRPAAGVTLTDTTPAGTTFVSFAQLDGPAAACTTPEAGSTGTLTCSVASLAPGQVIHATLTLRADPGAANGTEIANSAQGDTSTLDLNGGNDADAATVVVVAPPAEPPANPPASSIPPETTITRAPKETLKVRKTATVTYEFGSDQAGSTFRCRIDAQPQGPCTSPLTLRKLRKGTHLFEVVAVDAAGNADATPATDTFKVKRKRRRG